LKKNQKFQKDLSMSVFGMNVVSFPMVHYCGVRSDFVLRESMLVVIAISVGCSLAMAFSYSFPRWFVSLWTLFPWPHYIPEKSS